MVSFRKSKSFGPFRITASKSGLSLSAGIPGLRYSINTKGQARRTVSIPGTGIYQTDRLDTRKRTTPQQVEETYESLADEARRTSADWAKENHWWEVVRPTPGYEPIADVLTIVDPWEAETTGDELLGAICTLILNTEDDVAVCNIARGMSKWFQSNTLAGLHRALAEYLPETWGLVRARHDTAEHPCGCGA